MPAAPPILPRHTPLERLYAEWVDHYLHCAACQQDDWYSPWPEEPFFCAEGQRMFRAWVAQVCFRRQTSLSSV